ncbi:efdc9791-6c24-4d0a-b8a9-6c1e66bd735f [Sclerotinia trifoliorum]|uniref:Efdc9791-6c24-4d0a-b8a9-6c1e66bd735f n=1 Tax=Sclerotinia trifoliorum TaxID=28548 RepID=A0A8H2VXD4_9HELO|nr:efdc9791-6c24-4d0a-b8a9-6c1e66bd735f [Sclerotinia trifoliorum]
MRKLVDRYTIHGREPRSLRTCNVEPKYSSRQHVPVRKPSIFQPASSSAFDSYNNISCALQRLQHGMHERLVAETEISKNPHSISQLRPG